MKRLPKKRMPDWAKKPKGRRLKGSGWNLEERAERLRLIKRARSTAGVGPVGGMERDLGDYSLLFGVRFKALVGTKAALLQMQPKPRKVAVLGLGEGHGTAMREIKRAFGERVFVCVLDVARRISKRAVDEARVGDFETFPNWRFDKKFDFIFSVFGPTYHSSRPLYSIEKATALLEKGGRFFFQVDKGNVPYASDVIKVAERTGCTYRHAETGDYYTFEFRKK